MITRPLPISVEPYDDEPWNGYLTRVADVHRVPLYALHDRLGLPTHKARAPTNWGLAMTHETLHRYGDVLDLDPARLRFMLLQRFHGTALMLDDQMARHYDPFDPFVVHNLNSTRGRLGWFHRVPTTTWCPQCLDDDPLRWRLSWRLPWHVYCEQHHRLLSDSHTAHGSATNGGDGPTIAAATLAAQRRLLEIAYGHVRPPRTSALQYVHDVQATADILLRLQGRQIALGAPGPGHLRLVLADAVSAAGTPAGFPSPGIDAALQNPSGLTAASEALRRHQCDDVRWLRGRVSDHGIAEGWRGLPRWVWHVPSERRLQHATHTAIGVSESSRRGRVAETVSVRVRWVPQMMPMSLYAGALSDLTYPLSIERGRRAAALAAYMLGADTDYETAETALGGWCWDGFEFEVLIRRLQSEGRDDAYWRAVNDAVETLRSDNVDYVARADWTADEDNARSAAHLAGVPDDDSTAVAWFRHEWALLRPHRPQQRPGAFLPGDDGRLKRFAERYGQVLSRAATDLLEASVDDERSAG